MLAAGFQAFGDTADAVAAEALADQEDRPSLGVVLAQPGPDQVRRRRRVAERVVVFGRVFRLHRSAEAGPHRIEEDQVGRGQQGVGVVDQALVADHARAEAAELHPARRRAGAAVPDEGDRASRVIRFRQIGGVEQIRVRDLRGLAGDGDVAGLGRVAEELVADVDGLLRDGRRLGVRGRAGHREQGAEPGGFGLHHVESSRWGQAPGAQASASR
jgi:hypothetical protein